MLRDEKIRRAVEHDSNCTRLVVFKHEDHGPGERWRSDDRCGDKELTRYSCIGHLMIRIEGEAIVRNGEACFCGLLRDL